MKESDHAVPASLSFPLARPSNLPCSACSGHQVSVVRVCGDVPDELSMLLLRKHLLCVGDELGSLDDGQQRLFGARSISHPSQSMVCHWRTGCKYRSNVYIEWSANVRQLVAGAEAVNWGGANRELGGDVVDAQERARKSARRSREASDQSGRGKGRQETTLRRAIRASACNDEDSGS